jgi:beta-glucosidase-like glycosyl hydrolase/CubicO group peptidase (beta-lactamase class C family)
MRALGVLFCLLALLPDAVRGQATPWPGTGPWAEAVLDTLSLEAKIAQLFITDAYDSAKGEEVGERQRLLDRVERFGVGGVLFSTGDAERQAALTRELQARAKLPLLVAQDMEHGVGMRVEGTTVFPKAMALGAAADPDLAYAMGRHIAAEAHALGVHVNFAPVADVNNNPFNPIINVRSFGEDPAAVAALTTAALQGMQDGGLVATAKHFPGHGDTDVDSHASLPLLPFGRDRLDAVELVPFRQAIAAGVQSVMTGHLAVPALEPDASLPATLSPRVITGLLREELGFEGLIVTDGLNMGGITEGFGVGEAAVRAVEAGVDLLILVRDEDVARAALLDAIDEGRISEDRIDASVLRVLRAKEWLGLHRASNPDAAPRRARAFAEVAAPDSALLRRGDALAERIAERSLTLLRNDHGVLPLRRGRCVLVLSLLDDDESDAHDAFVDRLREAAGSPALVTHRVLRPEADSLDVARAFALAEFQDVILVSASISVRRWSRTDIPERQRTLVNRILAFGKPVVLVAFGNPYLSLDLDGPDATVVAYDALPPTQRAAADALVGVTALTGRLPVSTPGPYRTGDAITLPQSALRTVAPEDAGFDAEVLGQIDEVIFEAIDDRVFPGAVAGVGVGGRVVKMQGYGHHTYEPDPPAVTPTSIFDLASLTKVVGTTLAAMRLYDEGRLALDAPVVRYLPAFGQNGKDEVTIRQLLTHSAGQRVFHPFHREGPRDPDAVLDFILADTLRYAPGTDTRYSDFDMIVLGEVIEAITEQPLDDFLHEAIFEPLGMDDTGFRAPGTLDARALPTEIDETFRRRTLQGEVHDEAASLLGGVAGHAGLFSTAGDLARVAFLLTNGGTAYGHRLFSPATVETFTRRARPAGEFPAALGWIATRPAAEGYSSAGHRMGPRAFGHTGFTGTSIWIDPDTGLWVILLTNRTYPQRGESAISAVRPTVADLAVEAFEKGSPHAYHRGTTASDARYTAPVVPPAHD